MFTQETINKQSIQILLEQVENIKNTVNSTKQVYINVAKLLFLQYQEMPTANRLYTLVKKGSMTTVVEAMRIFWQDIQKQLAVKINMPNLPESLQGQMVDQLNSIWQMALSQAAKEFDDEKSELLIKISNLEMNIEKDQNLLAKQENINANLSNEINILAKKLDIANDNINEYSHKFEEVQAANNSLHEQINISQQEIKILQKDFLIEKNNLQNKFTEQINALQQDIKSWQNKLDNERTQFKLTEKDLNKQYKVLQNSNNALQENLLLEKQNLFNVQQEYTSLLHKYENLHQDNIENSMRKKNLVKPALSLNNNYLFKKRFKK